MESKRKNYELELPENYEEAYVFDATDKKLARRMQLAAIALMLAVLVPAILIIRPFRDGNGARPLPVILSVAAYIAYIVLHELVHGAAYKLTTGHKLSFGFNLAVAYCGVPDIYVCRKASMIALLAPFTVFTVVFALTTVMISSPFEKFLSAVLLAVHIGGCAGDLYMALLLWTRFKDPRTLTRDTGPVSTFYLPKED